LFVGGNYAFRPNDAVLLSHLAQQASGQFLALLINSMKLRSLVDSFDC
jgi:hypothetical protein